MNILFLFGIFTILSIGCKKEPIPDNPDVNSRGIDSVSVSPGAGNPPRTSAIDVDEDGTADLFMSAGELIPGTATTSLISGQPNTNFLVDDNDFVSPSDINALIDSVSIPRPPRPHSRWYYSANVSVISSLLNRGEATGNDFFLGMYLTKTDGVHYGWLKINVSTDGKTIRLKALGYHLKPRTAIKAGEI